MPKVSVPTMPLRMPETMVPPSFRSAPGKRSSFFWTYVFSSSVVLRAMFTTCMLRRAC